MGAIRRSFVMQVTFYPLTYFGIAADCCSSSKLRRDYSSLLNSDSSGVVFVSSWIMPVLELNRAQLLVHDDAALNKFRIDHGILEDVEIELTKPNEDANLVEGNGERIPISTTNLNTDLNSARKPFKSSTTGGLLERIRLPPPRIEGRAPQCNNFSAKSSRVELNANLPLARVQGWEESITSSSSSYTSFESLDSKDEEGEKVVSQLMLNKEGNDTNSSLDEINMIRFRNSGPEEVYVSLQYSCHSSSSYHPSASTSLRSSLGTNGTEGQGTSSFVELQVVVCGPIYEQLGPAPTAELPEFPKSYLPLILLGFNEKEYMNQTSYEDGEKAQVNEVAEPMGEAATEKAEEVVVEVGEAAAQNPPNKL
ncbi:hypothetical protein Acr_14g0004190 [Actinidia rufa]|uniref:Uncharacterized protein n=1 Tax=Actinidia rufa TaxID=165716 RepID=A0A7J0FQD7_9ERIC|nr:hypothetical protein Acr_14g0004190 [Actinidia rufa]